MCWKTNVITILKQNKLMQDRKYLVGGGGQRINDFKEMFREDLKDKVYDRREEAKKEGRKPRGQLEEVYSGQQRLPV